jgi:RNA polymerase sigma-70 factor, ECF subfamily
MTESDVRTAFEEKKDSVYRFVWRMTGSAFAAEDITQEVFLLLLNQPDRFDPSRGELGSFLIGVARNLARKWLRGESRWSEIDDDQFSIEPVEIADREISEIVAEAVASLPPLQREVLLLAHYEGFSLEEIARAVNVEVGAVKSRLFRARQNLKRILAPLQVLHGRTS